LEAYVSQKLVAAFRVLSFCETYDQADEYVQLLLATIETCVKKLLHVLNTCYEPEYLHQPTKT